MSNRSEIINSTLGRYYEVKNKFDDALTEVKLLEAEIEERQLVIDQYQRHYARHTFTKKITHPT